MKIVHINTNDKGGAATACIRIHLALLDHGVDSKILFLNRTKTNIPETYQFRKKLTLGKRIINKLRRMLFAKPLTIKEKYPEIEWFSHPKSPYDVTTHPVYKEADIVQLNWVSGFLDEPSFFRKNKKPVVWRMPDLYACGGGYHYEKGFPFDKLDDLLGENAAVRTKALKNNNIAFVAISNWVKEKADESAIIGTFPTQVIHNGLNFSVFKPMEKLEARSLFGLPSDKKIVLLGSDISMSKRKGIQLAIEALALLDSGIFQPVIFGHYEDKLPPNFIRTGYVKEEGKLAALYTAADLFCMPSIEEAFGQVTIEALACGVPVISFPNGGSLDIIKDGFNGILATDFTVEALSEALQKAVAIDFNSESIIKDIHERFDIRQKIEAYMELYHKLLKQ